MVPAEGVDVTMRGEKHGRTRRFGTQADIAWIQDGTQIGLTIASGIPPVFKAYATVSDEPR